MEWEVRIDGSDWTDALYSASISLSLNQVGKAMLTLDDEPEIGEEVVIKIDGNAKFVGKIRRVKKRKDEIYEVTVPELSIKLHDRASWIPRMVNGSMDSIVRELLSENLNGSSPYIITPGSIPSVNVSGLLGIGSRLKLIKDVCKMKSTAHGHYEWYVNPSNKRFYITAFRGNSSPSITLEEDVDIDALSIEPTDEVYNRVVVVGTSEGEYAVQAIANDTASQSIYGIRERVIKTSKALSSNEAQELATAYLKIYTTNTVRGRAEIHGELPAVDVGDVIRVRDRNGKEYVVRVSSIRFYTGSGEDRVSLQFSTFDETLDELLKTVEELQSDYASPSFAPNVFHQTKSDNFDSTHPVVWRVHIPEDIDKKTKIQLSYRVADFRSYVENEISASYYGNTGYKAPDGDTDPDDSYSSSPSANADSVKPDIDDEEIETDTEYPSISNTPGVGTANSFSNTELENNEWAQVGRMNLPYSYRDYGSITYQYSLRAYGRRESGSRPQFYVYARIYNDSEDERIPSSPVFSYSEGRYIGAEDEWDNVHIQNSITITYPCGWNGDRIYLELKPRLFNMTNARIYGYGSGFAVAYGRHYHHFQHTHGHTQEYHSHSVSVNSHSHYIPSLDVDVESHRHSMNISNLSATTSAGVTTTTAYGNHRIKVNGTQVYYGSSTNQTIDVTSQLNHGWNTITFSSTGKGYVDMVLEARGRLKTI